MVGLIVLAVAAAAVVALALTKNEAPVAAPPAVSLKPLAPTPRPTATTATLESVRVGSTVMFIGDSWTFATGADDPSRGYTQVTAKTLDVQADVFGYPSVGYFSTGADGGGAFQARFAADEPSGSPSLIVVQGSQNDWKASSPQITEAARAFVADLRSRFPQAQVLMVGPALPTIGLANVLAPVDSALSAAAAVEQVPYISPLKEQWFNAGNVTSYMNPMDGSPHPNNTGYKLYGQKLADAIQALARRN